MENISVINMQPASLGLNVSSAEKLKFRRVWRMLNRRLRIEYRKVNFVELGWCLCRGYTYEYPQKRERILNLSLTVPKVDIHCAES